MIYICTAIYAEAQSIIKKLNLKKDLKSSQFQIFQNEEIKLIITGVGKIKAAIAVTYLLVNNKPSASDILINIGICGAYEGTTIGTAYACNKIIDYDTKNTFFPDMLIKQPFEEASIITCPFVMKSDKIKLNTKLFDMEAAGVYQAAVVFMQIHQIVFIKIVSDIINKTNINIKNTDEANITNIRMDKNSNINTNYVAELIEANSLQIINFINNLKTGVFEDINMFSENEEEIIETLVGNLRLTTAMKEKLRQSLTYYKLQQKSIIDLLNTYVNVECQSKIEGKRYFAEIQQKLI